MFNVNVSMIQIKFSREMSLLYNNFLYFFYRILWIPTSIEPRRTPTETVIKDAKKGGFPQKLFAHF